MDRVKYMKEYNLKNKERIKAYAKQQYIKKQKILKEIRLKDKQSKGIYHNKEICNFYLRKALMPRDTRKPKDPKYFQIYYQKNKKRIAEKYHGLKRQIFDKLGNKCACCGFTEYSCLQIDHINDDGSRHRKYNSTMNQLKDMLEGHVKVQLLCGNCHNSKTKLGKCYHTL